MYSKKIAPYASMLLCVFCIFVLPNTFHTIWATTSHISKVSGEFHPGFASLKSFKDVSSCFSEV